MTYCPEKSLQPHHGALRLNEEQCSGRSLEDLVLPFGVAPSDGAVLMRMAAFQNNGSQMLETDARGRT